MQHKEIRLRGWHLLRWYGAWGTVRLLHARVNELPAHHRVRWEPA